MKGASGKGMKLGLGCSKAQAARSIQSLSCTFVPASDATCPLHALAKLGQVQLYTQPAG